MKTFEVELVVGEDETLNTSADVVESLKAVQKVWAVLFVEDKEDFLPEDSGKVCAPEYLTDLLKISASIPREEWDKLPPDSGVNLDHYLYGAPKAEP